MFGVVFSFGGSAGCVCVCVFYACSVYFSTPGLMASFPVGVGMCLESLAMPSPNWQESNQNTVPCEPWLFGLTHAYIRPHDRTHEAWKFRRVKYFLAVRQGCPLARG